MSEETDTGEPLVFDKAERVDEPEVEEAPRCSACKRPLGREYFTLNASETCEDCHHLIAHQLKEAKSGTTFLRAAGIGAAAALAGSIAWYAVAAITHMEIGLLAIAVGYLVGRAVRRGSRGVGGRRYQVLAMVLTYLSITGSYVPLVLKGWDEAGQAQAAKQTASAPGSLADGVAAVPHDPSAPAPAAPTRTREPSVLGFVLMCAFTMGLALVAPFLGGVSNIIGLLLIGIALYEAWKLTRAIPIVLGGPLRRKKKRVPAPHASEPTPDVLSG